jgi:hypothetical protein
MKTIWPKWAEVNLLMSNAVWVCNAMKMMVESHLKWGADFIVLLATDIAWKPDDISKLIGHNLPIVGGWASGRMPPFVCHVCDSFDENTRQFHIVQNPKERKGVEKIASNGGELQVFRRDVFEKIPSPWFMGADMFTGNRLMTEDYYFAKQAMKHGVDVFVDWDVKVSHTASGLVTYNGEIRERK